MPGPSFGPGLHEIPQRLARSPHPYQQNAIDLTSSLYASPAPVAITAVEASAAVPVSRYGEHYDADGRKRRKVLISPSDSGTEADDEKAPLPKSLPAPPVRLRRAARDGRGRANSPSSSPPLMPLYVNDERRRLSIDYVPKQRQAAYVKESQSENEEPLEVQYVRRRREEIVRRIGETLCLGAIGYLAFHRASVELKLEVAAHNILMLAIYALYPARLLWYKCLKYSSGIVALYRQRHLLRLHIPAGYDPAPLLYPGFLPIFVTVSMGVDPAIVLANSILAVCSLPGPLIPFYNYGSHWIFATLPLVLKGLTSGQHLIFTGTHRELNNGVVDVETLVLLFPLHRALVQNIRFLSTTSLLDAETQLLSIALINTLLFSVSPQMVILKAILWIGGVVLFASCRQVLSWAVQIARVPSWRFRRVYHGSFEDNGIFCAFDDTLGGFFSRRFAGRGSGDDSDRDSIPIGRTLSPRRATAAEAARKAANQGLLSKEARRQKRLREDVGQPESTMFMDGLAGLDVFAGNRSSAPLPPTSAVMSFHKVNARRDKLAHRPGAGISRPRIFLGLTKAQAIVLKWLYASYVYGTVIVTVLAPIRLYIGRRALGWNDPIGWAIGYLFGDISQVRAHALDLDLEDWICLPQPLESSSPTALAWAEHLRLTVYGAANTRLLISAYCLANIVIGLAIVFSLSSFAAVDTRRKVFHGMMVAMFLPTTFVDPCFVALALTLVLSVFLLLDLFRASQLPPVSKPLTYFLAPYVDGRDHRGPVVVSHIFLLIGCAIPLWLSLGATERTGQAPFAGWDVRTRDLSMVSGVVCVGMGDAAASLVGRRWGRTKWIWSGGKSLEGSFAFACAVIVGLCVSRAWLLVGGWPGDSGDAWPMTLGKAAVAAVGASFTEAVLTGGNDNVVVPVLLWLLVRGLRM